MSRVFVAGSINMDVVATAARHPLIGETVPGREVLFCPGGKGANQAVAAARLGATTSLIGRIGRDSFGADLRAFLAAEGIDLRYLSDTENAATGAALIVVAAKDNTIVVVPGANALLDATDVARAEIGRGDVLVSQFEIPPQTLAAFFARGRASGARTILNPAPAIEVDRALFALADLVILNETELAAFTQQQVDANAAPAAIARVATALRTHADQVVCVTTGKRGAVAVMGNATLVVAGREVDIVDTTGAGDCFTGAVAAELARGRAVREALEFANAAASICVQRMGAGPSMPDRADVEAVLGG